MTDGPRSMRARDADRDRVIAMLDEAYAEGQLSQPEREVRVASALAAGTLADLDPLVRDLQRASDPLPSEQGPRRRNRAVALVAGAAVLCSLGVAGLVLGGNPEPAPVVAAQPEPIPLPPADVPVPEPVEEPPVAEPVAKHEPLTVRALRQFVRAYREKFDTTLVYDPTFGSDGRVFFDASYGEVRKNRLQDWSWDPVDGFYSYGDPSANVFGYAPVDLDEINLRAVARNAAHARKYLNVDDPESVRAGVDHREGSDDAPHIHFYVSNAFNESGSMTTTLGGRMLQSAPFSPDGR